MGGPRMFRKLLLPALAIGLLGGCVSSGYQYDRDGYYYGQPSTTYRYSDRYYDSGYRYPGSYPGYYGNFSYGGGYRYPGYGYQGYGYGRYPYGYARPPVIIVRPGYGGDQGHRPPAGGRDNRAPWRDYERLQRERIQQSTPPPTGNRPGATVYRNPVSAQPRPAVAAPSRPAAPPSQSQRNSRSDRMIERARTSREVE